MSQYLNIFMPKWFNISISQYLYVSMYVIYPMYIMYVMYVICSDTLFQAAGKIKRIKIYTGPDGKKKGDALITFVQRESVITACSQVSRFSYNNRHIYIHIYIYNIYIVT